jgi:hypothetical protein
MAPPTGVSTLIAQRMRYEGVALPASPSSPFVSTPMRASRAVGIRRPNEANINLQMQRSVTMLNEAYRPTNTVKAQKPKADEFFAFCDVVYADDPYK